MRFAPKNRNSRSLSLKIHFTLPKNTQADAHRSIESSSNFSLSYTPELHQSRLSTSDLPDELATAGKC